MSTTIRPTLSNFQFSGSNPTTNFNLIPSNVTPETVRAREQFDDDELSALLWERLREFYGEDRVKDEGGCWWTATRLNEKFRLCRYDAGGKFSPHYDGRRMADVDNQSFMTVNIYLNTVPECCGGATRALASPDSAYSPKIQPVLGSAAIFRDTVWHDGEELSSGEKYLLRTDVMYRRQIPFDFDTLHVRLNNEEKAVKAMMIAEALEDAGNGTEAVEWYKRSMRLQS
ncbi:hypothetical protein K504DRAFT_536726 [Pleomassaria siparia CBS 279.74]|uniref:Prolyl 4-hydroxylase alpha subunit Fe(2+) 2OG dioxygenase domain-containing protein n=1 Tax=Pleomassaria siparia CBS 279.74 TaxID=1314801 RepID=A0A6G1JZV2_9PLEO|nr:hypothetical protein K504DRAFT_536726 [Pleomassaria siparia CBS 279.74]